MSYGIIEPEAFTSMMALLKITSAEEAEGKFEDTPLQTAFEVEVLSYEEQDEDDAARIGHKFQDWASFKKDTRTGGIGIAYGGKLWNLIAATLGEECARRGEFSPEQLVGKQFRAQVVRSGKNFDGKYSRLKWDNIWKAPKSKARPEVPEVEEGGGFVEDEDEPEAPDFSHLAS
jgi:hypothetical protein